MVAPSAAYYKTTLPPRGRNISTATTRREYSGIVVETQSHGSIQVRGEDTVAVQEGMEPALLLAKRKEVTRTSDLFIVCCRLAVGTVPASLISLLMLAVWTTK